MLKQTKTVYFYGFPRNEVTKDQIRLKIIEKTGIDIKDKTPQIKFDRKKPEWSAVVKLKNANDHKKVLKIMRFFRWPHDTSLPVIEIRALSYDPEYKLRNRPEVLTKTVFCRQLPADMCHSELFKELTKFVQETDIKSV